ncbi:MAG: sulfotransferase [Planctomycetota bacterium]
MTDTPNMSAHSAVAAIPTAERAPEVRSSEGSVTVDRPKPTPQPVSDVRYAGAASTPAAPLQDEPAFIVGAERSGTTLLRLMLGGHEKLSVLSEFEYVVDPLTEPHMFRTARQIQQSVGQPLPSADVLRDAVAKDWIFASHGFTCDPHLDYRNLANSFLHQAKMRADNQDGQILAMVHRCIDQLPRLWPWARYIHIVRDPRDVARSCIGMGWSGNVYHGVTRWIHVERQWAELRAALPIGRFMEVRQEELILNPRKTLERICEFLGVEWSDGLLSYQNTTTYDAPDPRLVEQWRRKLTAKEIGLVEGRVGSLLPARGYQPSGHPPIKPGPFQRLALRLNDRRGRIAFRWKSLGLPLWATDVISRKFKLTGLQRHIEPKLLEARNRLLK